MVIRDGRDMYVSIFTSRDNEHKMGMSMTQLLKLRKLAVESALLHLAKPQTEQSISETNLVYLFQMLYVYLCFPH